MTQRMDQEPDYGDPPLEPPTEEEQRGDAWEYWHERAHKAETALHDFKEQSAKLIEAMIQKKPWKDHQWARCALAVAATAVRRGRHLTEREKLLNLAAAMEEPDEDGESFAETAAKLRAMALNPDQ